MDHPASEDMECTVCFKYFDCPKLLPCGHLLCRDCLIAFLASQTEAKCHLCRCAIMEPTGTGERSLEDIADGFPTDLATRALVRAHRWLSQEHRCCVCADVTAVCTCLDCSDVFCESCGNVHRKQSATKRHNVQNLSALTAHKLVSDGRGTCRKHPCDIPVLFCSTHGVSICPTCFATEHRSCPEVTELTAKMEKTRAVMEELVNTLSAGEVALECAMKRMEMRLRDTERRWEEADAQVEEACDRLEAAVKERRRYLKELALKERNDAKDVIQQQCAQLSHRRGKLTSHKIVAQRAEGLAAPDWFDDMVTAMKERVHDLDRSTTLPNAKVIPSATFTIDPDVVSSIVDQLSRLGQMKPVPVEAPSACARSEVTALHFHDNHGKNVTVSSNRQTARRTSANAGNGILMSCDPMQTDMLYEVRIDEVNSEAKDIYVGVVTQHPDTFTTLPSTFFFPSPAVICIASSGKPDYFDESRTFKRPVLKKLSPGSSVGLGLDSARCLHLYINCWDRGLIAPDVPHPCYFMFDMFAYCTKVTALPVKPIN